VASAFAFLVADWVGWRPAFLILAGVMLLFGFATFRAPEPHYAEQPPRTLRESVVVPLRELLATPSAAALILLVVLFKVGDAFALRLFTPFMMDLGFSKTEIGLVLKGILTTSSIVGGILGGLFMVRLGLLRSMLIFGVLQTLSNFLYYALALTGKSYPLMVIAVGVDNIAGAMGNIASVALIMALCDIRYSAFQYALLSAFAMTPRYMLGGPAGYIAQQGGWDTYYIVSVLLAVPGLLLVWFMRDKIKQLDQPRPE
jgi:PAT family beta-lactamase induction signal transducer AmpG